MALVRCATVATDGASEYGVLYSIVKGVLHPSFSGELFVHNESYLFLIILAGRCGTHIIMAYIAPFFFGLIISPVYCGRRCKKNESNYINLPFICHNSIVFM